MNIEVFFSGFGHDCLSKAKMALALLQPSIIGGESKFIPSLQWRHSALLFYSPKILLNNCQLGCSVSVL